MRKYLFGLSLLILAYFPSSAHPNRYWTPDGLACFSASSVYSITQDETGAIWLKTNREICRYNGNMLETRYGNTSWTALETRSGQSIYSVSSGAVIRFSASSTQADTIRLDTPLLPSVCVIDEGESLIIASGNRVVAYKDRQAIPILEMDAAVEITSILRLSDGSLAIGTSSEGLFLWSDSDSCRLIASTPSKISALYQDSAGLLWAGLLRGGVVGVDPSSCRITRSYASHSGKPLIDVRSFSEDRTGNLYMGTAAGLFRLSPEGDLTEEIIDGIPGRPICCVFSDRNDNLWVGTYYHGVFFSSANTPPLYHVPIDPSAKIVKGLAEDRDKRVWILTDGNGLYRYDLPTGRYSLLPGTKDIKYQSAFYDARTNRIWTGEFRESLLSYDARTGEKKTHEIAVPSIKGSGSTIHAIIRLDEDLLIGGNTGLFLFNPETETAITRKVPGFSGLVFDMELDGDGGVYLAGNGIHHYRRESGVSPLSLRETDAWAGYSVCYDISRDAEGHLWMAFLKRGVGCLEDGQIRIYDTKTIGLADDYTTNVIPLRNGNVLVVSNSGVSILSPDTHTCFNFNQSSGLVFRSTRGCQSLVLSDGRIWIGGNDGIESLPEMIPAFQTDNTRVVLDKLFVNGERHDSLTTLPYLNRITLKHTQSHFSFDVTAFDYSKSQNITYRYRLEGFDKDWTSFSPQNPVTFMNMAPGQYRFVVQAARQNGRETAEASIPIRIRPAWYATAAAKVLFFLLAAAILYIILDSINSRILLAEKLKLKDQENKEKTRFFVNLSYQLRTPVNLVIGQLERFFQKYGSRTAGIEDLENIYGKVILMRQKISDFVNSQNDTLKNNPDEDNLSTSYQDAKFLNAAIGVVERNLFSKDMNVSLLCSELNVGKTSLTAKIKEVTGMTPREFIEDVRLKHAAEMLKDNVYRIAEISDNLAFSNPNYFSQRFKRKYGVSPRSFKGK